MLGKDRPFEFEWISIYTFQCRRLQTFVHGPVIFAGDAAHLVSPFGARGFNSGVQDIDNLAWKLAAVLDGQAPPALLATYGLEREAAADENLLNSTRSTDFITPKSTRVAHHPRRRAVARRRDAVRAHPGQLRPPVDARQSTTRRSRRRTASRSPAPPGWARPCPTRPCADADGRPAWLLDRLGPRFTLLYCGAELPCELPADHAAGPHRPRRSPTRRACSSSATTPGPARPGWSAPTSTWPPGSAGSITPRSPAATQRALGWELQA